MKTNFIYKLLIAIVILLSPVILLAQNKTDENGLKQGYCEKKNKTSVIYKGQFKDGKPYGEFKYYERGSIVTVLKYSSTDTALATHYHTNSNKAAVGYYVAKQKEGIWYFYDRSGVLASKENFTQGIKNGEYIIYNLNGTISRETEFVNGVENGYRKTYDSDHKILTEGFIKDGKMDGVQKIYRGGTISVMGSYKHAVRDGEWIYYDENGNEYKKDYYELGIKKN